MSTPRISISVFYDGGCGLCRPTIDLLRRLDLRRRIEFLDVHQDWPAIRHRFPGLSREACLTDMHAVDRSGQIFAGFDTYRAVSKVIPAGWIILPVLYVPGIPTLGRRVYRAIADRRHTTVCRVPDNVQADSTGIGFSNRR
jgi:predicted DCC family thiol-disulfide oxidoreductase YuxK